MSRRIHIRVVGRFEGRPQQATVTIDRGVNLFSVRPLRRRRTYTVPLADVAERVVFEIIKAEVAAKRAARKKR